MRFVHWILGRVDAVLHWHPGRRALIVWIIVFTLGTMYSLRQSHNAGESNKDAIHQLAKAKVDIDDIRGLVKTLRKEQKASCKNFLVLRDATNRFHGSLHGLLNTAYHARLAAYKRDHQASDLTAAKTYKGLLDALHQVKADCAQKASGHKKS